MPWAMQTSTNERKSGNERDRRANEYEYTELTWSASMRRMSSA